ncbi:MAG: hypothetical protein VBE63_08300 [Lamprobacter sp.]|uniref:hypothetical protein n=1 Tax=Lamprobacter sp. TaxID=3100796 RepID=UPI002B25CBCF|nr:hypothetical protein [Lamprobacter sp.]MEA3639930.1 hypothetical protein [Lamprobacter sp.]
MIDTSGTLDDTTHFAAFVLAVVVISTAVFTWLVADTTHKKEAIEQGCARYNPQTAEFEWVKSQQPDPPT